MYLYTDSYGHHIHKNGFVVNPINKTIHDSELCTVYPYSLTHVDNGREKPAQTIIKVFSDGVTVAREHIANVSWSRPFDRVIEQLETIRLEITHLHRNTKEK